MKWFNNLRIRNKIMISSIMFIVLIVIMALVGVYTLQGSVNKFEDFYAARFIPVRRLNRTMINMLQQRINMAQEYIALQDGNQQEVEDRIASSRKLEEENARYWKEITAYETTGEGKNLLDEFMRLKGEADSVRHKYAAAVEDGDTKEAKRLLDIWLEDFRKAKEQLLKVIDYQQKRADQLKADEEAAALASNTTMFTILGLAVLLGIGITLTMDRSIARPIATAVDRVRDIAEGEGDLTKRLNADTEDEVGQLAEWLNRFIVKIHDIVVEISKNTREIVGASQTMNEASQSLSAGTEQMSSQSQNIASAATQMNQNFQIISSSMEEMSISIGEVAKKSADASSIAAEADQTASQANEMIIELGASAKEIGKVIESIRGIADQTNLLALNASIEAAGAGDAGKGFAVVASEVKELARQAGTASEDIKGRVTTIQKSTELSVVSIHQITTVIAKVNEISGAIASAVEEQSITAKEIANNVNQSSSAASDVTKNIEGISQASRQGALDAQKVSELALGLQNLSGRLEKIVNQFRVKAS